MDAAAISTNVRVHALTLTCNVPYIPFVWHPPNPEWKPVFARFGGGCQTCECIECRQLAYDELTHRKTFRKFLVRDKQFTNDCELLERKFGDRDYSTRMKRNT